MIKTVCLDAVIKPMGDGSTRPIIVLCSDGNTYILKNEKIDNNLNKANYNCMFLNEALSYLIAKYLSIPVPESVIINVDEDFSVYDPSLNFSYRLKKGLYFGSRELQFIDNNLLENHRVLKEMGKKYINNSWKNFFKDLENIEDLAKIIAYDLFISNFDRYTNEGNILVSNSDKKRVYAIDHGHAFFGPFWNENKISNLKSVQNTSSYIDNYLNLAHYLNTIEIDEIKLYKFNGLGVIFDAMQNNIDLQNLELHPFRNVVFDIEAITEELLDTWFSYIPNEWYIDKSFQIAIFKNYILKQKNLIRYFIQRLVERNAFSNYLGGSLLWKEKNCGTAL